MSNTNTAPLKRFEEKDAGLKLEVGQSLAGWLTQQATRAGETAWLLAFADDGVIWGKVENGQLALSAPLDSVTLQTLHLFGELGELRLWKGEDGLTGCWLMDQPEVAFIDRDYILWGTQVEQPGEAFSLVADGRQGLRHAVPLALKESDTLSSRPLRLATRGYLAEDGDGQVYISLSRLVKLFDIRKVK